MTAAGTAPLPGPDPATAEKTALRELVELYRRLSGLAAQDTGVGQILELVADRSGASCLVVDRQPAVLAAASGPVGSPGADQVRDQVLLPPYREVLATAGRTRCALRVPDTNGDAVPVIVAPVLVGDDVEAYLVCVDDLSAQGGMRLLLAEHAAVVCGIVLGRHRVVASAAGAARRDLFAALLSGQASSPEDARLWAQHLGYAEDQPYHVVVLEVADGPERAGGGGPLRPDVAAAVEHAVLRDQPDAIVTARDSEVVVLVPEQDGGTATARRVGQVCVERLGHLLPRARVTVGIGSPCRSSADIARSFGDARHTALGMSRLGRGGTVVAFEDLGVHRLLLHVADPGTLTRFALDTLGPLGPPEHPKTAELLETLAVYLRENSSPQRASRALQVHPNTVGYRIRRIEEITGLDLAVYGDRLMAEVAVEILFAFVEPST